MIKGYVVFKCFADDGSLNYLVFQPVFRYCQFFTGADKIFCMEISQRLSEESIKTPVTSDNSCTPIMTSVYNGIIGVKFKENYLKKHMIFYS